MVEVFHISEDDENALHHLKVVLIVPVVRGLVEILSRSRCRSSWSMRNRVLILLFLLLLIMYDV